MFGMRVNARGHKRGHKRSWCVGRYGDELSARLKRGDGKQYQRGLTAAAWQPTRPAMQAKKFPVAARTVMKPRRIIQRENRSRQFSSKVHERLHWRPSSSR
jgi:hypothetical protein